MEIKNILVATESVMQMHRANSGKNRLGNASAIKRRPDGRVYIAGQMQRHAFFEALRHLDESEETAVAPGSATSFEIERDLRADIGGFMHPSVGGDAGRRTGPLSATPAVAAEKSQTIEDLLLRLDSEGSNNSIATQELSVEDVMHAAYSLDCTALSTTRRLEIESISDDADQGIFVGEEIVAHASPEERLRRAKLALKATQHVNAFASQARNMAGQEPRKVLIVLGTEINRKGARYFQMTDAEKEAFRSEAESRGDVVITGDDTAGEPVYQAYEKALGLLEEHGIYQKDWPELTYEETYEAVESSPSDSAE